MRALDASLGVDERLVELLSVYGLSEKESRIFIFLTRNGARGAGEVAKSLGIRRMEAYRVLKRLLERGVAVSTAGKPIRYQAEDLDGVLSLLTDEQRHFVRRMDDARTELSGLWEQVPRASKESFENRFRIIQGREQIYASVAKMVEGATSSVKAVLTKNDLIQAHLLGIVDMLIGAAKRGARVEVMTVVDQSTIEAVEPLVRATEVKHSEETAKSRLVVVDDSQALVSLVLDDTMAAKNERDVAIWTDSKNYAEMMSGLYEVSFGKATGAGERLAAVKAQLKFGDKVTSMVAVLRTALGERGWMVETPGTITGSSGSDLEFSALLSGPGGRKAGLEVVFGSRDSPVGDRVTASALKKLDIKDAEVIIVASPMPDERTRSLATLIGATVFDGTDPVDAAAEVRNWLA